MADAPQTVNDPQTVNGTQSVLQAMAANVTARKTPLTPVGPEGQRGPEAQRVSPLPFVAAAMFPNDNPTEVIVAAVAEIRRQMAHIAAALDAVDASLNPTGQVVLTAQIQETLKTEVKIAERQADEAAAIRAQAERLAAKEQEAQAAVFTPSASTAWSCPIHDERMNKTSRLGRNYGACPVDGCDEFERLT